MEFLKSLALVVIPIIIGAISTYFLSHSWQKYSYKIEIKKQLLEEFHKYTNITHSYHEIFMRVYLEEYGSKENIDGLLETGEIKHTFNVPSNPDDLPIKKLSHEYKEFFNSIFDGYKHRTYLISLLRLYSDSANLITDLKRISNYSGYSFSLIRRIMKSVDPNEVVDLIQKQYARHKETDELINSFEEKIANLKIRKIPT